MARRHEVFVSDEQWETDQTVHSQAQTITPRRSSAGG